jgi:hypothetical protein
VALRVSTVNADVVLSDLGTTIVHPTINRVLTEEFSALDLKSSLQLTAAIHNGQLLVDDGTFSIASDDYDPDAVLIQQLGYKQDVLYVSEDELRSKGDIAIYSGVFPLSINSTAQASRNVYVPTARWITWELAPGDRVVLTGVAAGSYTVASVTDQQNFIVVEPIVNSTYGDITAYHPAASTRIGVSTDSMSYITGDTLQEALISVDSQLGASGGIDLNRLVLDTEGKIVYSADYDIVITALPLPHSVLG